MKKILSVLLSVSLLLSACVMLTSCLHKCEFSDEWSKDENAHWHACTGEKCEEISDKADHTWDDGVITTTATQEEDGVKTFTCTVCQHTKTEPIEFTGLTNTQWAKAFLSSEFQNFSYKEISATKYSGITIDSETIYKFTSSSVYAKITIAGDSASETSSNPSTVSTLRSQLLASIKEFTDFDSFEYDAETKTYKATKAVYIEALNASTSDITLKFDGNKLVEIKYTASFTQSGIHFDVTSTVTLSDYGTTSIGSSL